MISLRATVGWSYDLLTDDERAVFDVLSVFVDGASLEAVEAVVTPEVADPFEVPELIDGLVRKSMIVVDPDDASRYLLLETLRQFGLEQLAERGGAAVANSLSQSSTELPRRWTVMRSFTACSRVRCLLASSVACR